MRKKQRLRRNAILAAKFRGHQMTRQWVYSTNGKRQSIKCRICGMHSIIDLDPPPNGIDISGQAVALHCLGKEMKGGEKNSSQ